MDVRELRFVLTVDDYDAALTFYRDVLGLDQQAAYDAPQRRPGNTPGRRPSHGRAGHAGRAGRAAYPGRTL